VVAPEVVVAAAAMAAFSCCDTTSMVIACLREVAIAAWMVATTAAKSDGATLEVADLMMMVSRSVGSGVAMVEVRSGSEMGWCNGAGTKTG
jgi:hypothetical protein